MPAYPYGMSKSPASHARSENHDALRQVRDIRSASYRERPAYRTTVEDSVYVRADRRGCGVGSLLLEELLTVAVASGFHVVMARIVDGPTPPPPSTGATTSPWWASSGKSAASSVAGSTWW